MVTKYPQSRDTFKKRFGLLLTDEQIERIARKHHITKSDLAHDSLGDSLPRDLFIDLLVTDVLGRRWHWPLLGDSSEYWNKFCMRFPDRARAKGLKLSKRMWR